MAKIKFEKIMTMGEIKALLQKNLNSKISVEIKKNRIEVAQDSSKGCVILLNESDGKTSGELSGYMPSGGLRAAITIPPFAIWLVILLTASQSIGYIFIGIIGAALPAILIIVMKAPSQELVRRVDKILRKGINPIELKENQIGNPRPKVISCPNCGYIPRFNERKCRKCGEILR